jgi:hypothetical protein
MTVVPDRRGRSRGGRVLATLALLLLAAAAGLGVAAYVESGDETWRSTVAVQLYPGPVSTIDPDTALKNGVATYIAKVPGLTLASAQQMGIPVDDVRGDLDASEIEPGVIGIAAQAAHSNQAALLAGAGATDLINLVKEQEKTTVPNRYDRLIPVVAASVTPPERTRPDDAVAALAGGLTALTVLLVGGLVAIVRRSAR